ncbi:hypothetical protein PL75_03340 [Neisseria arctica]|uniref:Uncharacterized protein n=1 Tax=Neisseria arctica TaxID=1470200 RepID=A0A0J0YT47_9NEIS|nr:hypothetical protein PL75_03340 [Neisseria arctica]
MKCYRCAHADFKSNANDPVFKGFLFCGKVASKATRRPSNEVCDNGKFEPAGEDVMNRRRVFFESNGKVVPWKR